MSETILLEKGREASPSDAVSPAQQAGPAHQNISTSERVISAIGGAVLMLRGVSRGGLPGLLLAGGGSALLYRGWSGHCEAYQAMGIDTSAQSAAATVPVRRGIQVEKTVAVNRSPEELFDHWRDLQNLPQVMSHLEAVEVIDDRRSRWKATGPLEVTVEWEAEIVNEDRPQYIHWRSLPGSQIETAGTVSFRPLGQDRGTAVAVSLKYDPPGGKIAAAVASLLGSGFEEELTKDLRRFKSVMETGESPVS